MPWLEVSTMDRRREFVMFASREGANVSVLCRRYGISRQTGYKWLGRFGRGEADFSDRSGRPLTQPNRTPAALEGMVLAVRDAHPAWGARKIAWCLARDGVRPPAVSTVHAILRRHGRIKAGPSPQRPLGRFEKAAPNLLWQMDFKGRTRIAQGEAGGEAGGTWCHPLTVLDDHSRYALCLEACANERTLTVKLLLEKTFRRYGLPGALYLDNGPPPESWGVAVCRADGHPSVSGS